MIVVGELKPGDRLPPEKDLSERLGISRSSLRESVKALELLNVLNVRQGDGTYVTSLEPRLLLEAVSFVVDFHHDESLLELFEVRRILEPAAAAMAAVRVDDAGIAALRELMTHVDENTSVEDLVAHDLAFHRSISILGGNSYLVSLLDGLSSHTVRARVWRGLTEDRAVSRTLLEHTQIIDALARHDPDTVRAWATVHISGVEHWLREALAWGSVPELPAAEVAAPPSSAAAPTSRRRRQTTAKP